jgi:hypothetical protein
MIDTDWGYSVDELQPILSVDDFRLLCPGLSSTDEQLAAVLEAVGASIRNYCGWHVSPVLECTYIGEGDGDMLFLPAMGVKDVKSLSVDGATVDDIEWKHTGIVRHHRFPDKFRSVTFVYDAGFSSESIGQVVAQIASNAVVAAPGVANERAGDVSITYNQTGTGITGGVSLLPRDYELLAPYKLARAW